MDHRFPASHLDNCLPLPIWFDYSDMSLGNFIYLSFESCFFLLLEWMRKLEKANRFLDAYSDTCVYFFRYPLHFLFPAVLTKWLSPHSLQNRISHRIKRHNLASERTKVSLNNIYWLETSRWILYVFVCMTVYMSNATSAGKAKYGLQGRRLTSLTISQKMPSDDYSVLPATQSSLLSIL